MEDTREYLRNHQHGAFIDTASQEVVANVLVDARPRFAQFKDDGSELWANHPNQGPACCRRIF
jgi:hypothetical protein